VRITGKRCSSDHVKILSIAMVDLSITAVALWLTCLCYTDVHLCNTLTCLQQLQYLLALRDILYSVC
jgi:hypothetical protein